MRFHKEMGITRKEFLRTLAAALPATRYSVEEDRISIREAERRITIKLHQQAQRRIGSLQLPSMLVEFSFSGYAQAEAENFMRHIDIHFRRGGG